VAGVLIIREDGKKVLLIKHKKLGVWIYPGGHIEEEENPLDCAIRESKEETGATFRVLNSNGFSIDFGTAKSLPQPLVVMNEIVPYSDHPHEHFDMIYLGVASSTNFQCNEESSDCKWFDRDEIDNISTFENVKKIIKYGFRTFREIYGTSPLS
jgi:8-oxo-dGTP pyrophosphatase MutT (NUDIX family)